MVTAVTLTDICQCSNLDGERFDLAIGYVAPDRRSIANMLEVMNLATQVWAFISSECISSSPDLDSDGAELCARKVKTNLARLQKAEHKICGPNTEDELQTLLSKLSSLVESPVRVFIDVSAFPRRVLATILNALREAAIDGVSIRLTISYRLAAFSKPRDQTAPPNKRVAPVSADLAGWPKLPGLPVHLIVGLGYERGKALGAVEYLQPSYLTLFSPQSPEKRFADQVAMRNKPLLEGTPATSIFEYQVLEPATQIAQLSSMLASLVEDRRPVLLPFGPKIFFAVCVLLSFGFPEVSVWHVSGEEEESVGNLAPSDYSVHMGVTIKAPFS